MTKWVYRFGDGAAEGRADMKNLLGGKGAGLAEMSNLGLPVPPGFTITTEVCTYFYAHGKSYPPELREQVADGLAAIEQSLGARFGDADNPLLVSVRSGARRLDAGHDGHRAQPRAQRPGRRRAGAQQRRRALRL